MAMNFTVLRQQCSKDVFRSPTFCANKKKISYYTKVTHLKPHDQNYRFT